MAAFTFMATASYAAGEPARWVIPRSVRLGSMPRAWPSIRFDKDTATKSKCNGKCATEWPPLMAAAGAANAGDWTVVTRDDGCKMWAYKGHPLYTFVDDKKPGQVTGTDGFHFAK